MMTDKLRLEVLLAATQKVTGPLKAIMDGSSATAKALKAAKDQLKGLNAEQSRVNTFNKTVESARQASAAYKEQKNALEALNVKVNAAKEHQASMVGAVKLARAEHSQLMKEFAKSDSVPGLANKLYLAKQALEKVEGGYNKAINSTRRLKEEFKGAGRAVEVAKKAKDSYSDALKRVTTELKDAGIGTKNLSAHQEKLKASIAAATLVAEKHGKTMQRLSAAQSTYDKSIARRNSIAGAGAATVGAGAAMGLPIVKAVKDFMSFEDAMLGVARQVDGARDSNGKLTATYYEMGESIKAMAERIPLATTQIAAIVESGARMGIQGKENLLAFAEATAVMTTAFDLPADQIGESIGKLSNLYNVPIKDIKQLGDAINYLDDNAQSKGGDIINVMQRIAGTAAMVKMSYKDAAALGSTFLSLGSTPEIAATASNAMIRELSIATMQTKKFKEGLGMLKMDTKSIQLGMNKDATGTIIKVLEAIKSLPQEKQLEAATRLFGKEYGDDAAKLAEKLDEYRRQLTLVNAEKSKGSMDREAAARNEVLSARLEMAKNAVFNLSSQLGSSLKPALADILEGTASVIRGIRDWVKEHPRLTSTLVKGAAIIATLLTVVGALALSVAAVLGPFAVLRLGISLLGIRSGVSAIALNKLGAAFLGAGKNTLALSGALGSKILSPLKTANGAFAAIKRLAGSMWAGSIASTGAMRAAFMAAGRASLAVGGALLSALRSPLQTIRTAFIAARAAALIFGRALLLNPVGIGIAAIVLGAALIYKYWEPIKAFFAGFWGGLATVAGPALQRLWDAVKSIASIFGPVFNIVADSVSTLFGWIGKLITPIQATGGAAKNMGESFGAAIGHILSALLYLPTKCLEIGSGIVHGIGNGILGALDWLKSIISKLAANLPEWMKSPLGIHSPSRVFAAIGGHTMAGLENGLLGGKAGALAAMNATTKALTAAGAGIVISGAAMAVPPEVIDASRNITDRHLSANLPAVPDVVRQIRDAGQPEDMSLRRQAVERMRAAPESSAPARPSGRAPAAGGMSAGGSATYIVNVYPQPGADGKNIAREVEMALAQIEQRRQASKRSSLRDRD